MIFKKNKILLILPLISLLSSCTLKPSTSLTMSYQSSKQDTSETTVTVDTSFKDSTQESSTSETSELPPSSSTEIPSTSTIQQDPYESIDTLNEIKEFYNNYSIATSYEDAQYRTIHHLLSGKDTLNYLDPVTNSTEYLAPDNSYYFNTTHKYEYNNDGSYRSYILYNYKGEIESTIYYNGGYQELSEVATYLYAFGEVPPNSNYESTKTGKKNAYNDWYKFGRVNKQFFTDDTSKYKYEPSLPDAYKGSNYTLGDDGNKMYMEIDVGTLGRVSTSTEDTNYYYLSEGSDEGKITRGVARLVYTYCYSSPTRDDSFDGKQRIEDASERYVFYTYNHYNDFQQFLNYNNGFGLRFGNISGGGTYGKYNSLYPPTQYPDVTNKNFN